jgi:hypothetical protein
MLEARSDVTEVLLYVKQLESYLENSFEPMKEIVSLFRCLLVLSIEILIVDSQKVSKELIERLTRWSG